MNDAAGNVGKVILFKGEGKINGLNQNAGSDGSVLHCAQVVNDLFWEGEEGGGCLKEMW